MNKAVLSLLIVFALIFSSFMGIFLLRNEEETVNSPDSLSLNNEDVHLEELGEDQIYNSNEENIIKEGDIDWKLLPENQNPSVKLFAEKQILAIEFRLPEMTLEKTVDGEVIYLEGSDLLLEPGKPMVPEFRFFAAVPSGSKMKNIEIIEQKSHELLGQHHLAHYVPRTLDGIWEDVEPDPMIYSSPDPFPYSVYEINGPDKLRHLNAIEVVLYPFRMRPLLGVVEVLDLLRITICLGAKEGKKMLSPSVSAEDTIDRVILKSVANPEDVVFSPLYKSFTEHGTRAPSTIEHALGFRGLADAIHPTNDTTMGNADGVALLQENDDRYYNAESGKTLYMDGFDISSASSSATLVHAMLHVQYKGPNGYDGNSKIRWTLEGGTLKNTSIQPQDLDDNESADESYDLLGHVGSPSTVSDLLDLDIEFTENGVGAGSKDIPFDYIWIEFVYREELTGDSDYLIITNLEMANELRPLSEWKTHRLKIDTQVYDTEWINSNWEGKDLMERTHDFTKSMFENYSIEYILLGGDETVIPTNTSDSIYDTYYSDVVGFRHPDIAIGRLPTDDEGDMEGMVNDILVHQRDLRSWKKNMYLIGTNVFSTGDGKRDMEHIKDYYMQGHGLVFYEDYEVEGNISRSRTINTYNQGMGASVITGHGSKYGWYKNNGTSNFFNRNDVRDSMTNSDKRGFVWSSTCSSAGFVGGTVSIGEMWVVARDGGGIGYIGAAEIAYYSSTRGLYRRFFSAYNEMLLSGDEPTQGICHLRGLNGNLVRIYNLMGDPQVGLTIVPPKIQVEPGIFESGNFVPQIGFDQDDQVTFNLVIQFPSTALPRGVNLNLSVNNDFGGTYYLDEVYIDDPDDIHETMFLNWTVPSGAVGGIYNFSMRIFNTSQNWEFVYESPTYFFVDYRASILWIEQLNSEVIEGDTVTYRIHIDNFIEPIPQAKVWVHLQGRDYEPYQTPFDYYGFTVVSIPTALDLTIDVDIPIFEPGTYNVTAGLHIDWALMDSTVGDETGVRGIRILDVEFNHPLYFREDTATVGYRYLAYSDFPVSASLIVEDQSNQLYNPYNIVNGTSWLNFTWSVPEFLPNRTYGVDLEISGFARSLETKADDMRVVVIREILDLGEKWLLPRQQPDGGWEERDFPWPPGTNRNDTSWAMQALIWSGVDPAEPEIQDAADFVEDNLDLSFPGEIDEFAQNVWALAECGRGTSQKVVDAGSVIRKMQNWIYEPETWGLYFYSAVNTTWFYNISEYDENGDLLYWEERNGFFSTEVEPIWMNFTMYPGTAKLNITMKTSSSWFNMAFLKPPYYNNEPSWQWLRIDDYHDGGDGDKWNCTMSEEIDFDKGWGKQKGMPSIAGYTAWGIIGLIQSNVDGPFEREAIGNGVQWLFNNQSVDGSWLPWAMDGNWGNGWNVYPEYQVGNWADDFIQNTAVPVIALVMNGSTGQTVDDAVEFLKGRQEEDGSYPYSAWGHNVNIISTAHTLRALSRAGYVFDLESPYVKEGVRWLCAAQHQTSGGWDEQQNYTRVTPEAMMALSFLHYTSSMDLEEGWNLVSLDLTPIDTSLDSVLETIKGDYDAVQWYDANDAVDPWKHFEVSKPSQLNDLYEINPRVGFWIHVITPGGTTFRYTGKMPYMERRITLYSGWNLVGFPSLSDKLRIEGLNNIIFGTEVDLIQSFDAVDQEWVDVGDSDYLEVGKGYWVHSKVEKTWAVPF
ncbi:MAG: hypothetical protein JSV09_00015 [Thermoplasmata archaeon]|nr:MAG: hypothetical protein JSV09_00015 [Thermoplasmata archaeon]